MNGSLLSRGTSHWLLDRALHEGELTETIRDLGRKLVAGRMPVCRILFRGLLLHPISGALDITWGSAGP